VFIFISVHFFVDSVRKFLDTPAYYYGDQVKASVARMGEMRNAFKILVGRCEWKMQIELRRCRWEDNIRMDL
jgi:hypothetical protein